MTEAEWLSETQAYLLMEKADSYRCDDEENPTGGDWRSVAARVACLERLGSDMPEGVEAWVRNAIIYLNKEQRLAPAGEWLFDTQSPVYEVFRRAYLIAIPELRQRLAAAQDVFHGTDYYACEEYLLDTAENSLTYTGSVYLAESAAHCNIIRDIFGNPFRPITYDPAWRTSTVLSLAQQMYNSRDFTPMPVLADALQDAGCENEDILSHCRGDGPHVRGCWVVDLILGKE